MAIAVTTSGIGIATAGTCNWLPTSNTWDGYTVPSLGVYHDITPPDKTEKAFAIVEAMIEKKHLRCDNVKAFLALVRMVKDLL